MKQPTNPFMNFDMFKTMTDFDPSKTTEQFSKIFSGMNLPKVDVESFVSSQRKSVEAMNVANQKVLEGVRAVAERQTAIMQAAMENSTGLFQSMGKIKTPQEAVEKQIELAKTSYDKAVKDMNELGSMINKVNTDAVAPINARIQETFTEARNFASVAAAK